MTKITRHLLVLVGAIAILALAFAAVAPVYAQDDDTTDDETMTYTTVEGDTLSDVLNMAGIDVGMLVEAGEEAESGLREFFDLNPDLAFVADAQVTVPDGIVVTGDEPAEGEMLTLSSLSDTYALDDDESLRQFMAANENLQLVPGQTVQFPASAVQDEAGQTDDEAGQVGESATHTVAAGDTLQSIADQYGITLEELVALNPDLLQAGDTLVVPAEAGQGQVPGTGTDEDQQGQTGDQTDDEAGETDDQGEQTGIPQTGPMLSPWGGSPDIPGLNLDLTYDDVGPGHGIYIVQGGDSLSSIADRFGLTVPELWAMNPTIENPNVIYSGQRIRVSGFGENIGGSFASPEDLDRQLELTSPDDNNNQAE